MPGHALQSRSKTDDAVTLAILSNNIATLEVLALGEYDHIWEEDVIVPLCFSLLHSLKFSGGLRSNLKPVRYNGFNRYAKSFLSAAMSAPLCSLEFPWPFLNLFPETESVKFMSAEFSSCFYFVAPNLEHFYITSDEGAQGFSGTLDLLLKSMRNLWLCHMQLSPSITTEGGLSFVKLLPISLTVLELEPLRSLDVPTCEALLSLFPPLLLQFLYCLKYLFSPRDLIAKIRGLVCRPTLACAALPLLHTTVVFRPIIRHA